MMFNHITLCSLAMATFLLKPLVMADDVRPALAPLAMQGCDAFLFVNFSEMRDADICKQMKGLRRIEGDFRPRGKTFDKWDEMRDTVEAATGLAEDDFVAFAIAVKLDGLDLSRAARPKLEELDAVLGLELAKPLSDEQLEASLKALIKHIADREDMVVLPTLTQKQHDGQSYFVGPHPKKLDESMSFATIGGGNVFVAGSETGVKNTLERNKSGATVRLAGLFPEAVLQTVSGSDLFFLFAPTPEMSAKMKAQAENGSQNRRAGVANLATETFAQMKAFGLGINVDTVLDASWVGDFGSAPVAQQAKSLLDTQFISGVKMFATMFTEGKPLPLLATLRAETGDENTAFVKMSLCQEDIRAFTEAAEAHRNKMKTVPQEDQIIIK